MRRHSIWMDNQLLNQLQASESNKQYLSAKKQMRDILITRIDHIDVSFLTNYSKITKKSEILRDFAIKISVF